MDRRVLESSHRVLEGLARLRALLRRDDQPAPGSAAAVEAPAMSPTNFEQSSSPDEPMRGSLIGKGDGWNVEELDDAAVARQVAHEVARQDAQYGPFADDVASVRLAVACLEDEVREARDAWDKWKRRPDWFGLRQEAIQVAAVASRLARLPVEVSD